MPAMLIGGDSGKLNANGSAVKNIVYSHAEFCNLLQIEELCSRRIGSIYFCPRQQHQHYHQHYHQHHQCLDSVGGAVWLNHATLVTDSSATQFYAKRH